MFYISDFSKIFNQNILSEYHRHAMLNALLRPGLLTVNTFLYYPFDTF